MTKDKGTSPALNGRFAPELIEALAGADPPDPTLAPFPPGPRGTRLLAQARAVFNEKRPNVLELVLRAVEQRLTVERLVGERLAPQPVRGDDDGGVLVRHRFGDRHVAAHLSATRGGRFIVTVDVDGPDGGEPPLRVTLWRGPRELVSEVPRDGRVMFPQLDAGHYRVVIEARGQYVGELDLAIERAAA